MKYNPAVISFFFQRESTKRNIRQLVKFLIVLSAMVAVYSILFHFIMAAEGQHHTWLTGAYWTLTVMSTLGFGDITFRTDLGRVFPIVVMLSGIRELTECSVFAIREDGAMTVNPDPQTPIRKGAELILIGTDEGEQRFLQAFEA